MSIPNSLTIPFPHPSPLITIKSFSKSVIMFLFCKQVRLCHFFLDSVYKGYHTVFLSLWLTSLRMTISSSIHVAANGITSFFLMAE